MQDYTNTFTAPVTALQAFDAAAHPERWWNVMVTGDAETVGGTLVYDVPGLHHSEFAVTEAEPGRRLVWHVQDTGADNEQREWVGTDVIFEFQPNGDSTEVTFTHRGLRPQLKCHEVCSTAWDYHLDVGLRALLVTGQGTPITPESIDEVATRVGAKSEPGERWKPMSYPSVSPYLICQDAEKLIGFIEDVFHGVVQRRFERPDGSLMHAEVRIDDSIVMIGGGATETTSAPAHLHVYVPDARAVFARAIAAGAEGIREPAQADGDDDIRGGVRDPWCGVTWWIATQCAGS